MIKLLPNTSEQTITIVPRTYPTVSYDDVQLVITEDGTNRTETISDLVATKSSNGNYVTIPITFSILTDESAYFLEFTRGGELWYRDKAYVSSQTNNKVSHTLNTNKYTEDDSTASDDYILLD
jgi:hypothetical protein